MLANPCPATGSSTRPCRLRRSSDLKLRTRLQVDARMRSPGHFANSQPDGCVAAIAPARSVSPRLRIPADTFRGVSGLVAGRAYPFSARSRGGNHTDRRVPAARLFLSDQGKEAARAR